MCADYRTSVAAGPENLLITPPVTYCAASGWTASRVLLSICVKEAEIIDLPERADCCGFGGVFSLEHPELSAEFLKRKIAKSGDTTSPTLVVCDTGCLMHIQGGLQRQRKNQQVVHIAQVLDSR